MPGKDPGCAVALQNLLSDLAMKHTNDRRPCRANEAGDFIIASERHYPGKTML
jgi:hypothetical protein